MKKTLKNLAIILLVNITLIPVVYAAKGMVVYYKSGCSYYIVETSMGYALLEWYGGSDPDEEDILVGDYETYGMKDIYNVTSDSETKAWVEDFYLSKNRVIEKYFDKCD